MEPLLLVLAEAGAPAHADFFSLAGLAALLTLAALEIVLGIDNIVFIAILTGRLPEQQRARARTLGLLLAMVMRLALLALAFLVMKLQTPLFELPWPKEHATDPATGEAITRALAVSGKDLVLLGGGLFLIAKATWEIHHLVEDAGAHDHDGEVGSGRRAVASLGGVLTQIMLLDLVFSLDSVITAVGMTDNYWIMASAVVAAVLVMLLFSGPVARFVEKHPTMKTLALSFLVLIGVLLIAEGLHQHLSRGYVYFAMAFSLVVELINLRVGNARRRSRAPLADG
jgi:predicted tellurium resistance membrane protein TerC